jgi:hydrogenase maturation protease
VWDELSVDPAAEGADRPTSPGKVLVAGIGNIFLGDDGFGVEVARQLLAEDSPPLVEIADFGIRGVHLAYELLGGYDLVVLVDAVPGDDRPGTVSLIEVPTGPDRRVDPGVMDAHRMDPAAVLAMAEDLGGVVGRVVVVGCQPAALDEGIGLSDVVASAVPAAIGMIHELIASAIDARDGEAT